MGCMPEGMVEVPAGDFLYGDPTTSIFLPTFYLDKYPVTAGDYKACVDEVLCQYNGSTMAVQWQYNRHQPHL
jgi:formylglycine-generating enzyme required for sulfatase activity